MSRYGSVSRTTLMNTTWIATNGRQGRRAQSYVPPLNGLSVSAAAAFSTRLLTSAYTGKAMNVRRSSDNATQDIGFVNGVLDTASLLAFVGANNGFVTTWYDQSGNGANVTQATATNQPQIVASGVVNTSVGGKPTIYSNIGTPQYLRGPNSFAFGTTATSVVSVFQANFSAANPCPIATDYGAGQFCLSASNTTFYVYNGSGTTTNFSSSPTPANNTPYIYSYTTPTATNATPVVTGYINGSTIGTSSGGVYTTSVNGFLLFVNSFPDANVTFMPEIVLFKSVLSTTDRQSLERNQEAYYGIAGV